MRSKVEFKMLTPGFLVLHYDPERAGRRDFYIDPDKWDEMKEKGFYGGVAIPYDVTIQSLSDEQLAEFGLQRIQSNITGLRRKTS